MQTKSISTPVLPVMAVIARTIDGKSIKMQIVYPKRLGLHTITVANFLEKFERQIEPETFKGMKATKISQEDVLFYQIACIGGWFYWENWQVIYETKDGDQIWADEMYYVSAEYEMIHGAGSAINLLMDVLSVQSEPG